MLDFARSLVEVAVRVANEQIKCLYSEEHGAKINIISETAKKLTRFFYFLKFIASIM